jgi:hypothetical protein
MQQNTVAQLTLELLLHDYDKRLLAHGRRCSGGRAAAWPRGPSKSFVYTGGFNRPARKAHPVESVLPGMVIPATLSRSVQLRLNGRAVLRDLVQGDFHKLSFHLRGLWRAIRDE